MIDESVWIQKARQGDRRAYRHLYERHASALFRFLHRFSSNRTDVEEWVQRAFIKAFTQLDTFDERARFSSWLFRIGINEMKSDARRVGTILTTEPESLPGVAGEDDIEWNATMQTFLDELTESQRMVFVLTEVEGYTHAEIAGMLGFTEGTSRSLLSRAKQHLRTRWLTEGKRA
jgi:RNA polymerase sigma-70 factor (ECF subfamily)